MIDREKVVAGLTMLADRKNDNSCEGLKCCKIAEDTLALLKEQEKENSRIANEYLNLVKVASKQPQIVRCKDCRHWKPPHIALNDGKQRLYIKGKEPTDPFGIGVTIDVGINIGGKCWLEQDCGYGRDMRVFRKADDYCSRAVTLPEGTTAEEYWGLSEEPAELRPDSD